MGAGQLNPPATEGELVLVQAPHRLALARLTPHSWHIRAAKVHFGPPLPDRELDRSPTEKVERTRMVTPRFRTIPGVDRGQALAVAIEHEAGLRDAAGRTGFQVDEMARPMSSLPPRNELPARTEAEVAPLAGFEQEIVEAIQRDVRRLARWLEPLTDFAPSKS
jgi:hypothetical protein